MKRNLLKLSAYAVIALALAFTSAGCSTEDVVVTDAVVTNPEPAVTTTVTTTEPSKNTQPSTSSSMRTYTNTAVGYTVQYPATWKVDEKGGMTMGSKEVTIRSAKKSNFGQVTIGMELESFESIRTSIVNDHKGIEIVGTFAGYTSYRYTFDSQADDLYNASSKIYVPQNDRAVYIQTGSFETEDANKIVSSFKFL